jgi:hypothetical protein
MKKDSETLGMNDITRNVEEWITLPVSTFENSSTVSIKRESWGEGRWLVIKPKTQHLR